MSHYYYYYYYYITVLILASALRHWSPWKPLVSAAAEAAAATSVELAFRITRPPTGRLVHTSPQVVVASQ